MSRSICGKPVPIQEREIEDYGRPVRDNCCVAVVLGETRTSGSTGPGTMPEEELFPRLIADGKLQRCSVCGYPFPDDVRPSMCVAFAEHLRKVHESGQSDEEVIRTTRQIEQEGLSKLGVWPSVCLGIASER